MRLCTLAVSVEMSFWELVVFSSRPFSVPNWGTYLMKEFQKSVSERG
ncbi:hypothetical protein [Streptosporangium longisporum]